MRMLVLVVVGALLAGCAEKKDADSEARGASGRKIVDSSKKGQLATYRCNCTEKEWTQPAEEEKLCLEYCKGEMPECGTLVKIEPAPK